MSRTITAILAACTLAALAPAAHAEPVAVQVRVPYSDLDLDDAQDARTLFARLERAALRACGGRPSFDPYYDIASQEVRARFEACYAAALNNAVAQFDAPQLARVYAETHGVRRAMIASR